MVLMMRILTQREKGAEWNNELVFQLRNYQQSTEKMEKGKKKCLHSSSSPSFVNYTAGKWNKVVKLNTKPFDTRASLKRY